MIKYPHEIISFKLFESVAYNDTFKITEFVIICETLGIMTLDVVTLITNISEMLKLISLTQ